jgi:acetyl esterase/lipase
LVGTLTPRYALPIGEWMVRARIGRRLVPVVLALAVFAFAPRAVASPPVTHLGQGAREVWVLWPHGRARSVVVFGHGWSTPFPSGFGPWVAHLQAGGSIVVYPRYRVGAGDSTSSALAAFQAGIVDAFKRIGRISVPVIAVGKSFGGSAVFYYAAAARTWGVPAPTAILSIFPALPIGSLPSGQLARSTYVEFFVGDADTTAGSAGADAFWRWLTGHPSNRKRYVVIRSRPGFVANHDSAQRSDKLARAIFWTPLDLLIARARAKHP